MHIFYVFYVSNVLGSVSLYFTLFTGRQACAAVSNTANLPSGIAKNQCTLSTTIVHHRSPPQYHTAVINTAIFDYAIAKK